MRTSAVAVALTLLTAACSGSHEEPCVEARYPSSLNADSLQSQRDAGADVIRYDVDEAALVALVFHECRADYKVVFYKQRGATGFERFGAVYNLLDYDAPHLDRAATPVLRTRHRGTNDAQFFRVTSTDVDLVPERGEWQPITPGVALRPSSGSR